MRGRKQFYPFPELKKQGDEVILCDWCPVAYHKASSSRSYYQKKNNCRIKVFRDGNVIKAKML